MGSSTYRSGIYLSSNQEGYSVWSKLVEEGGEEIHSLEGMYACGGSIVRKIESWNDEKNKTCKESDLLHHFAAIELVIDHKGGKIITTERNENINKIIQPVRHNAGWCGATVDRGDEFVLEQLVPVEKDIIAEPASCCSNHTETKVADGEFKRLGIITCDTGFLLCKSKLLAGRFHLVSTIVH